MALSLCAAGAALWVVSQELHKGTAIENVLLISIDTLRADHVSSYGFARKTTPHIDAVAREGILFKNVLSPVPQTLPAHCSMMTGTIPAYHGTHDNMSYGLGESNITLAEMLKEEGFVTGAIVSSFVLDSRFHLDQGFDTYNDRFVEEHKILELSERKGDEAARFAVEWLEKHARERFFLFLHFYDPHDDYAPPEPFRSQFAGDPYSGEVAFADHCVGKVLEKLKGLGLYDSTLIVITSDHGEMLGEHGELTHKYFIYQSALKVPLIFKAPGVAGPKLVEDLAGLIDIVPTIAGLLGIETPPQTQGRDLSPWIQGDTPRQGPRQLYAESTTPARYYGAGSLLGLAGERWKYIHTTRPELYDLERDPGETTNLVDKELDRAAAMRRRLEEILKSQGVGKAPGRPAPVDEATRRRLEALGYLGGPAANEPQELEEAQGKEDPKDLIGFYRSHQRLAELTREENYEEARRLCETMLRDRPDFMEGHLQMGRIATALGELEIARDHYAKAAALEPDNERAHVGLASLLQRTGSPEEAIAHYRRALELARLLLEQGRTEEAAKQLREARAAHPDNAQTAIQLGLALASQGKLNEAAELYRQALVLDPSSAEAHFFLGNVLSTQGRVDEAIDHYRQALRSQPGFAQVHDRLGLALKEQGKTEEALRHFEEAARLDPRLATAHNNLGLTLKQLPLALSF